MSINFEQAIEESLRAVQVLQEAVADIRRLIAEVDQAVSSTTKGTVRVGDIPDQGFITTLQAIGGLGQQGEDQPPRTLRLAAYRASDQNQQREICQIRPSRTGYPVDVFSFHDTKTSCPDFESLESKVADIVRDSRFGLKLKSLMAVPGPEAPAIDVAPSK